MKQKYIFFILLLWMVIIIAPLSVYAASENDDFYNVWRSGNYDCNNGKYAQYSCRICYYDYLYVNEGDVYKVTLSDSKYRVLIRELDESKKLLNTITVQNSGDITLKSNTRYLGVSVYVPGNTSITYEDYHRAFLSGLNISVSAKNATQDTVQQEDLFYKTWRSGNYDCNNGKYAQYSCRICYYDYLHVNEGDVYKVTLSDSKYRVLIRELDESKKLLNTITVQNSGDITLKSNTRYLGVSVYVPGNASISYEDYHVAFLNGLVIEVSNSKDSQGEHSDKIGDISDKGNTGGFLSGSISSMDFVQKMGVGWNLGNALLCYNDNVYSSSTAATYTPKYYETLWGNIQTTKKMITTVKDAGFQTIRIPVTYKNHIDSKNQIDPVWMARVKEVVDYAISQDMYVIINMHHEDWLLADVSSQQAVSARLSTLWTQIATYFAGYDEHLLFEGFNEAINSKKQWDIADSESYKVLNYYNQVFVNAVRSTGGNNLNRYLVVKTYAAKASKSGIAAFTLPNDVTKDHLIVGVHVYDGIENIPGIMSRLNTAFISKGVPVIVSEWGLVNNATNTTNVRVKYVNSFLTEAKKYGIACIWWDDGCGNETVPSKVYNYALLCRKNSTWYFPEIVNAITGYYK